MKSRATAACAGVSTRHGSSALGAAVGSVIRPRFYRAAGRVVALAVYGRGIADCERAVDAARQAVGPFDMVDCHPWMALRDDSGKGRFTSPLAYLCPEGPQWNDKSRRPGDRRVWMLCAVAVP